MADSQVKPVVSQQDMTTIENYKYKIYKPIRLLLLGATESEPGKRMERFCERLQANIPAITVKKEPGDDEPAAIFIPPNIRFEAVAEGKLLELFLMCVAGILPMEESEAGVSADEIQNRLKIPGVVRIYVSSSCPHCPEAVSRWLYTALYAPEMIELHIIEASMFFEAAAFENIKSVPTAVLDGQFRWTGVVPVSEILDVMENLDPGELSAETLKKIISDGDAEGLANLMISQKTVIPGFLDLLAHTRWPTRLGAMVAFEYLAGQAPELARQALDEMWSRFSGLDDTVKGDVIHLFGVLNDRRLTPRLESVINGAYAEPIKQTAREVIADIE
ncbi:MAG: thioredoxin family protein [Desulfobacteraceae bacterium]|nr:thioredoxin family protein [Desulfobacteraceae bacterium]